MKKNIFITGAPSSGKTTAIKKIIELIDSPVKGFYTEEERSGDRRTGFRMNTLYGRNGYLAHQNIDSPFKIRRYGVSIENIESIAVPSIAPENGVIITLDEIGKMECFSELFKTAAAGALNSECIVIGTITLGGTDFIYSLKERQDIDIIELTPDNRDAIPDIILRRINENRGS